MATGIRVLPRSLAPLPDESLPGFLLRLADRLQLSVAAASTAAGLSDTGTQLPLTWMVGLEPERAQRFARTTRLTVEEVDGLTLGPLARNFPPLDGASGLRRNPARWIVISEPWVFGTSTRYCPECLAGDGSEIQERHGGGWNKHWRLAPVFACTRHARLLEHLCPVCLMPAQTRHRRAGGGIRLVPAAGAALHPLQCRSAADGADPCPGRFDLVSHTRTGADGDLVYLLALQDKYDAMLRAPDGHEVRSLGQTVSVATYFADLRFITVLLRATWTTARPDTAHRHLATDLDDYQAADSPRRQRDKPAERYQNRSSDGQHFMPLDAAAGAALLALADEIIAAEGPAWQEPLLRIADGGFADYRRTGIRQTARSRSQSVLVQALSTGMAYQAGPAFDAWTRHRLDAFLATAS